MASSAPAPNAGPRGPWYTAAQAADYLETSLVTVRRLIRSGHLRCIRLRGTMVRINRAWLDEFTAAEAERWRR